MSNIQAEPDRASAGSPMPDSAEDNGTLVWLAEFHQDAVDDSLTNPVPDLAARLVANAYDAAERRGHTIIQWRISCMPKPPSNEECFRADPGELADLEGRRVMKMTADTIPCTEGGERP